jgi:glycerol-3-phosphate cytidylyltransferase
LKYVDCTFIFEENDPIRFLNLIKPDVHVKGGDYTPEQLPEKAIVEQGGGKIEIVPFLQGYSTTNIVKKILSSG